MRKKISVNSEVFQRVFEVTCCKTQLELANFLSIHQSSISESIRKENIPAEWLLKLVIEKNINPAWILSGNAPKFLSPSTDLKEVITQDFSDCQKLEDFSNEELLQTLSERMRKNVEIFLVYKPE